MAESDTPDHGPVTEEKVWATADRLRAAGTHPSIQAVRGELGRGSMSTVSKYLKTWHARQAPAPSAVAELPDDLVRALREGMARQVAGARAELEARLAESERINDGLIEEADETGVELARLRTEVERLDEALSQCQGGAERAEQARLEAVAELARERETARAATTDAAKAQLQAETLQQAVASLREERDTAQGAIRAAEDRAVAAERTAAVAAQESTLR